MKIKSKILCMQDFVGGMIGWLMFQHCGFEKAYYVWDEDTPKDPDNTATVLMKGNYISIRTNRNDTQYIIAISKHFFSEPHDFEIKRFQNIVQVTQRGSLPCLG